MDDVENTGCEVNMPREPPRTIIPTVLVGCFKMSCELAMMS